MTKLPEGKYLFAVVSESLNPESKCEGWEPDTEQGYKIYIEPLAHWLKEHCLADGYSGQEWTELTPVLDECGLAEMMESTYEMSDPHITAEGTHDVLIDHGFVADPEFVAFMEECDSSEDV